MRQNRTSVESEVSPVENGEVESFDPNVWSSEWPHERVSLWDAWSKVYERFGVAAERCNDLETGMIMLVAQKDREHPEIESLLSALSKSGDLPLGRLIVMFSTLYGIAKQDHLFKELERARKSRNYLIHHFYRDRGELFRSPEGCARLAEILVSIHDDLDVAVQRLEEWCGPRTREEIHDQINEDVAKWRRENQQMLDAILGKQIENRR